MKNFLWLVVVSSFFLIHCGNETGVSVIADEVQPEGQIETSQKGVVSSVPLIVGTSGKTSAIAVDAGFIGNGDTVNIPTGFTVAQCKFTAAATSIDGAAISTYVSVDTTSSTTAVTVICRKVVQERKEVPAETQDCVASYTVICVKDNS